MMICLICHCLSSLSQIIIRETIISNKLCRPKNKKSGYSKRISFIDLDEYRVHQIDFYNRRGDLEKTLKFREFRRYESRFWRAHVMIMVNLQTGKSTQLFWDEYRFNSGLTHRDFTPQSLPKASR